MSVGNDKGNFFLPIDIAKDLHKFLGIALDKEGEPQ